MSTSHHHNLLYTVHLNVILAVSSSIFIWLPPKKFHQQNSVFLVSEFGVQPVITIIFICDLYQ